MFLHAGWLHLLGNMLFLWVFGQNVEDALGHSTYLVFYLVCGLLANVAQVVIAQQSTIPSLGASGAIAGVLGAFLVLFPFARVRTLVRVGWLIFLPSVPAYLMLVGWFLLQFASSIGALATAGQTGGVAYSAHVTGFVVGFVWGRVYRARQVDALVEA